MICEDSYETEWKEYERDTSLVEIEGLQDSDSLLHVPK